MSEPAPSARQERRQFHALDLMRGLAAIFVVAQHLDGPLYKMVFGSHLAVDLFFMMSGFVLEHAYGDRLRHGMSLKAFMKARVVRLYPLYILGSAFGALVLLRETAWPVLLANVAFAAAFVPAPPGVSADGFNVFPLNYPAWSLFWELVANALYGFVAARLTPRLLGAILLLGAVLLVIGAVAFNGLDGGANCNTFVLGALRVVYGFFAGVVVYRIWASARWPRFRVSPWAAAAILMALFMARRWHFAAVYDVSAALIVFPLLVFAAARGEGGPRTNRICTTLGALSYPLYALHGAFTPIVAWRESLAVTHSWIAIPFDGAFIAAMLVLAMVAERFYDRPLRRAVGKGRLGLRSARPGLPV